MTQFRSLVLLFAGTAITGACSTPASPPQTTSTTVTVTPPSTTETAPPADPVGQPVAEPAGQPVAEPAGQPVAEPGKPPPVAKAPQDPSAPPAFVACTKRSTMCTKEYNPVCGVVDTGIRCIRAPCPSTAEQTFGNACEACADTKTTGYRAGACSAPSPQGNQADLK